MRKDLEELVVNTHACTNTQITLPVLLAIIDVESGGRGFDAKTGKLLIQFEPHIFKRRAPGAEPGLWSTNIVDVQSKEWRAFNDAFSINPDAAMESTSIGLPQIMGFHYARLGYPNVGAMWDDFKSGEEAQVSALIRFIETDPRLAKAAMSEDWHMVATVYNGAKYKELAARLKREPYNVSLEKAHAFYAEKYNG